MDLPPSIPLAITELVPMSHVSVWSALLRTDKGVLGCDRDRKKHLMEDPKDADVTVLKVKVSVAELCLTLCEPIDCSLPGSSVHGILQASMLEWVAIPFSRGSS